MAEEPAEERPVDELCGAEEAAKSHAQRTECERLKASQRVLEIHNDLCHIRAAVEHLEKIERPRLHVQMRIEIFMLQLDTAKRCHDEHVDIVRQISKRQEELDNRVERLRIARRREEERQQHRQMRRCMSLCTAAGPPAAIRLQRMRAVTSSQDVFAEAAEAETEIEPAEAAEAETAPEPEIVFRTDGVHQKKVDHPPDI